MTSRLSNDVLDVLIKYDLKELCSFENCHVFAYSNNSWKINGFFSSIYFEQNIIQKWSTRHFKAEMPCFPKVNIRSTFSQHLLACDIACWDYNMLYKRVHCFIGQQMLTKWWPIVDLWKVWHLSFKMSCRPLLCDVFQNIY